MIIKNSRLTFLVNLCLAFYLFLLASGSFLFLFPICHTFISLCAIHLPEVLFPAVCRPHCPLMAYVFKDNVCAHNIKYADESWYPVGWQSPANINWQAPDSPASQMALIASPMPTEIVIFMKSPSLQISYCWHKFTGCFQVLMYDLCI